MEASPLETEGYLFPLRLGPPQSLEGKAPGYSRIGIIATEID